jgi:hypothetical protein
VSRDDYFLKADNNKQGPSVHALVVFTIVCFLDDIEITYPLQRPESGDFDTENNYRKPLVVL